MGKSLDERLEHCVVTSARHLPHRTDIREREWLAQFDEYERPTDRVRFTSECVCMAIPGFMRGLLLRTGRLLLMLFLLALPSAWGKIAADWTVLPAFGILVLMLIPALEHQAFDTRWYPNISVPTWPWRLSALAWLLLFLSAIFVAHDPTFVIWYVAVLLATFGWDLHRVLNRPAS